MHIHMCTSSVRMWMGCLDSLNVYIYIYIYTHIHVITSLLLDHYYHYSSIVIRITI